MLGMEGLTVETLTKYNVKVLTESTGVVLLSAEGDVYKWAKIIELKNNKIVTQTIPR